MFDVFRPTLLTVCVNPVYYFQQLPLPILVFSRCVRFWLLLQLVKMDMKTFGLRRWCSHWTEYFSFLTERKVAAVQNNKTSTHFLCAAGFSVPLLPHLDTAAGFCGGSWWHPADSRNKKQLYTQTPNPRKLTLSYRLLTMLWD